jgi:hypothetical protein
MPNGLVSVREHETLSQKTEYLSGSIVPGSEFGLLHGAHGTIESTAFF